MSGRSTARDSSVSRIPLGVPPPADTGVPHGRRGAGTVRVPRGRPAATSHAASSRPTPSGLVVAAVEPSGPRRRPVVRGSPDSPPDPAAGDDGRMAIDSGPVEVWWAGPADAHWHLVNGLDDAERRRMARVMQDADRARYLVAHALARYVLGSAMGIDPREVSFD